MWEFVRCLSDRERSVFLLRYVEELEFREIEQCTGLKVGALKVYLNRALTKVRDGLEIVKRRLFSPGRKFARKTRANGKFLRR
ncbi:RNA polymerase sigma factor [Occallatibacter riparius]|uniref:RNA polymerase sigma factor n=1 Tax=Occallatibacter riparius TaxID=1002689 RepID=UPI0036F2AFF8